MDYSPSSSSVHGILQARILRWVAILSPRRSSRFRDQTLGSVSPALASGFFITSATGRPQFIHLVGGKVRSSEGWSLIGDG